MPKKEAPRTMDDRCREGLAKGKVVLASTNGRFISEHDTVEDAINEDLKADHRMTTQYIGPATETEQGQWRMYLEKKGHRFSE